MKKLSLFAFVSLFLLLSCGDRSKFSKVKIHTRHIELEGEPNFRDLGGYKTEDGKTVKWGQVYRSGKLSNLTESDVKILDSLDIRTVVNLLAPEEIEQAGIIDW